MIETRLEIPAIGAETLFLRPDRVADFPGVVFLTDIWGIRPANIGMARRLADKGFAVLMPNVLHRYSRITPDGLEPDTDAERNKALPKLFAALTPAEQESDGMAYVDFLLAQTGVKPGKVGVVGHCFTCATGAAPSRARPMKAPCTVGRCRDAISTTNCRPNGHSKRGSNCSTQRSNSDRARASPG